MENEKLLLGWFMKCHACRATFIRITQADMMVDDRGRILTRNVLAARRKVLGFVKCPSCFSQNVRLAEIGDRK